MYKILGNVYKTSTYFFAIRITTGFLPSKSFFLSSKLSREEIDRCSKIDDLLQRSFFLRDFFVKNFYFSTKQIYYNDRRSNFVDYNRREMKCARIFTRISILHKKGSAFAGKPIPISCGKKT